jgi:hypothetical protein
MMVSNLLKLSSILFLNEVAGEYRKKEIKFVKNYNGELFCHAYTSIRLYSRLVAFIKPILIYKKEDRYPINPKFRMANTLTHRGLFEGIGGFSLGAYLARIEAI